VALDTKPSNIGHRFNALEVSNAKCAETRFTHGAANTITLIGRPSKHFPRAA